MDAAPEIIFKIPSDFQTTMAAAISDIEKKRSEICLNQPYHILGKSPTYVFSFIGRGGNNLVHGHWMWMCKSGSFAYLGQMDLSTSMFTASQVILRAYIIYPGKVIIGNRSYSITETTKDTVRVKIEPTPTETFTLVLPLSPTGLIGLGGRFFASAISDAGVSQDKHFHLYGTELSVHMVFMAVVCWVEKYNLNAVHILKLEKDRCLFGTEEVPPELFRRRLFGTATDDDCKLLDEKALLIHERTFPRPPSGKRTQEEGTTEESKKAKR